MDDYNLLPERSFKGLDQILCLGKKFQRFCNAQYRKYSPADAGWREITEDYRERWERRGKT